MIQRRTRPSFSKDDEERLLAFLDGARHLAINYSSAGKYDSPQHTAGHSLMAAIDKLAEQITGDPKFFWAADPSIGGPHPNQERIGARQARELRWRELRRKY